ncbi:hypothetical protein [uncultured Draconibacterium sp.]|uniref:hypothetical protein n=1 Tax=uncultured Draconibacterium sp. TaxID=1573823 RepID=UPI0032172DB8
MDAIECTEELIRIAILLCPVFSSLFAILILLIDIKGLYGRILRLNYYLVAYFCTALLSWFSAILYFYAPVVYMFINWILMLVFMLMQIFFYGFIFEVTRINHKEKFSRYHYFSPVLLSLFLLTISLMTPAREQLNAIQSKGIYTSGSKFFFYLNYSKIALRQVFVLVYAMFGFKRLLRFQRFVKHFSSNEEKSSLRWVSTLLFFSIILGLTPLLKLFSSRDEMVDSPIAVILVLFLVFQYAYLCLHVIKRERFIIDLSGGTSEIKKIEQDRKWFHPKLDTTDHEKVLCDETEIKTKDENIEPIGESCEVWEPMLPLGSGTDEKEGSLYLKKNILSRESFDRFIQIEKPYLNADLKITDLVQILHVNRTYISSFINREYGVNFSAFINKHRLQEYIVLKKMPEYSKTSKSELAELAGFNSYRSFQRTEKMFRK